MANAVQIAKAKELFKQALEHKTRGEGLALELLRHPDTTIEQLADARRCVLNAEDMMRELVTGLRATIPLLNGYFIQHPWHAPIYNRYNQPKEKAKEKANE